MDRRTFIGAAALGTASCFGLTETQAAANYSLADPRTAIRLVRLDDINLPDQYQEGVVFLGYLLQEMTISLDLDVEPIVLSSDYKIIDGFLRYTAMKRSNREHIKAFVLDRPYQTYEFGGLIFGEDIKQKIDKGEDNFWLNSPDGDVRAKVYTDELGRNVIATSGSSWRLDDTAVGYNVLYNFETVCNSFSSLVRWQRYGYV